jgi:DNA-binding CsgD family transcriptional regulator
VPLANHRGHWVSCADPSAELHPLQRIKEEDARVRSALKPIEQGQRFESDERPSGWRGILPRPDESRLSPSAGTGRGSGWHVVEEFELDGFRYRLTRRPVEAEHTRNRLTTREWQVLAYASRGYKNKDIAEALGLAPSTVGVLLSRAARKLGTKSRKELLAAFVRLSTARNEP